MQTRQQKDERELIRSYLLGGLDGARLEQFELRLLSDSRLQDALNAEQDELFDDYSFGLLSSGERERFERHFLAVPRRAERLFFAQAMKDYLGDESRRWGKKAAGHASWRRTLLRLPARRKLAASFAVAACFLTTITVLVWRDARQREDAHQREDARAQLARAEVDREVLLWTRQPPAGGDSLGHFVDLTLTPGVRRESASARRIVVTGDTLAAQLRLELTDKRFESCEATLLTGEDAVVFTVGPLRAKDDGGDRVLVLRIPAKFLPAGDYQLKVRGTIASGETADAGIYSFQVVHRPASP
jgi:hypothetical protein